MEKTWKPTVTGILDIVAGAFSLVGLTLLIMGIAFFMITSATGGLNLPGRLPMSVPMGPAALLVAIALPLLIADVLAIIGGIYAIRRKKWGWALTGSIAALFAAWPLGIAAIVFTVMSQKEFE